MATEGDAILVVEDDVGLREALQRLLAVAGFTTRGYSSAEAFLADESAVGAVCVVCDLKLPAKSGLELLDELRLRRSSPPLILMTAHDAPGVGPEAIRRGAAAYLAKPFPGTTLLDVIAAVTGRDRCRSPREARHHVSSCPRPTNQRRPVDE
jgi:FixJ family two-component response regulator